MQTIGMSTMSARRLTPTPMIDEVTPLARAQPSTRRIVATKAVTMVMPVLRRVRMRPSPGMTVLAAVSV